LWRKLSLIRRRLKSRLRAAGVLVPLIIGAECEQVHSRTAKRNDENKRFSLKFRSLELAILWPELGSVARNGDAESSPCQQDRRPFTTRLAVRTG